MRKILDEYMAKGKILIVDDDADIRDVLRLLLEKDGYEIVEASNGEDAISLIDGKGGGSPFMAQGAGKNNANLDGALDYAFNKIKEMIG